MSHAASPHHRTSHGHESGVTWHACIVGAGQVIWVGKSSMVIAMSMRTKPSTEPWVHARFTFVARDQKSGGWKLVAGTGGKANVRGFGLMAGWRGACLMAVGGRQGRADQPPRARDRGGEGPV